MSSVVTLWIAFAVGASASGQEFASTPSAPVNSAELWSLPSAGGAEDCRQPELLANGSPVMASTRNGLSLGISLARHAFKEGEPIELHIWVDNTGDAPAGVFTCMDLERFMTTGFEIVRQDGSRVLSRNESKARESAPPIRKLLLLGVSGHARRTYKYTYPPTRVSHAMTMISKLNSRNVMLSRLVNMPYGCGGVEKGIDLCSEDSRERFRKRRSDLIFTVTGP